MPTVRDVTYDLLRWLDLTTVVGNPGSTEEPFLKNFPDDFHYVLGLQEASVVSIADGLAQGLRKPVLVNVHTGPGTANAMGAIFTAYQNKTPLIITAGNQTREMLLIEPWLTNVEGTLLPRPWVKWSYEPARPEDVPGAFMRAYAMAVHPPRGPVYLSLPLSDWEVEIPDTGIMRTVATRVAPDPSALAEFVERIKRSQNPVLVYGADVARSEAWDAGVQLAERLNAPVWASPYVERTPFPESHPLFRGVLPAAIGPVSELLAGHDLVIVIGAQVFRYYPYVAGDYLPAGASLIQVTDDPAMAAKAPVGDSLLSDSQVFFDAVLPLVKQRAGATQAASRPVAVDAIPETLPIAPATLFSILRDVAPEAFVLVDESGSNIDDLHRVLPIDSPDTFYSCGSGGLGWAMPAAVGLALAERCSGRQRPVIAVLGDGASHYCVQSMYSGVQQEAHVIFLILKNDEYAILKEFALLEGTPGVPGLDFPGIDYMSLGAGYGARAMHAENAAEIRQALQDALAFKGTSVIEIPISTTVRPLLS
jgi:benzoylformate decarboxylase